MPDESHLDDLYFVDALVYNCPFCKRRHVRYSIVRTFSFDWTNTNRCHGYVAQCHSCDKRSMHLTYKYIGITQVATAAYRLNLEDDANIDELFFHSVPTSFFTLDDRIPRVLRELIAEADGCLKGKYLTGASACVRKVVYELARREGAQGDHYQERIKALKRMHKSVEPTYFDSLLTIQKVTSSKVHEDAYDGWEPQHLRVLLASLREVLHELYVAPAQRTARRQKIEELGKQLVGDSGGVEEEKAPDG